MRKMKSVVMEISLDIEVVRTVGKRAQTDEKWTHHTKNWEVETQMKSWQKQMRQTDYKWRDTDEKGRLTVEKWRQTDKEWKNKNIGEKIKQVKRGGHINWESSKVRKVENAKISMCYMWHWQMREQMDRLVWRMMCVLQPDCTLGTGHYDLCEDCDYRL